jgi:elongation factor G
MTSAPPFLVEVALELGQGAAHEDLASALSWLLEREHDLRVGTDTESGMVALAGPDEYRLDDGVGKLREHCAFEIVAGAPQVVYRETLTAAVAVRYTHKQVLGGSGEFALVSFVFEPMPEGSGVVFESETPWLPTDFIAAAEAGIRAQAAAGSIAGFPLTDFKARLADGKYHELDSTPRLFNVAARGALCDARVRDAAVLLRPQMRLEIATPEDVIGGVVGDLEARGASWRIVEEGEGRMLIEAEASLANILFYRFALASMSQGRADCAIAFDRYVPVDLDRDPPRFPPAAAMRVA